MTGATWRSASSPRSRLAPASSGIRCLGGGAQDVLSAFFGLLALLAYARYVETTKAGGWRASDLEGLNDPGDVSGAAQPRASGARELLLHPRLLLLALRLMSKRCW